MKYLIIGLATLLIGSNLFWMYVVFDNGVTQTYQDASMEMTSKTLEQAIVIANLNIIGRSLEDARSLLPSDVYGLQPFVKEGCLYASQLCLKIDGNSKITAVSANEP